MRRFSYPEMICHSINKGLLRHIFPVLSLAVLLSAAPAVASEGPGREIPSLGNHHIQSPGSPHIPYNSNPPTSGPHVPYIVRWGIHQVPIPREIQVHNLEDGGVLIQYHCSDCGELISKLERLVNRYKQKAHKERVQTGSKHPSRYESLILAPYPGMETAIALTAWGRIDQFDQFDEDRIVQFIEAYIGIDHHPAQKP